MVGISHLKQDPGNLKPTLELILKNAVKALKGSAGLVAIWSEAEQRFVNGAAYGLDASSLEKLNPLLEEAIPDLIASKENFTLLSKLASDAGLPITPEGVKLDPIVALPLHLAGKTVGLIYILRPLDSVYFTVKSRVSLSAFADQAAIAIQNARLAHIMAAEKQRLESIFENSAEGIVSIDGQRHITGFNRSMESLTGMSREDVLAKECFRVLNVRDNDGHSICNSQCPMLVHSQQNNATYEIQGMIQSKHQKDLYVAMNYSVVYTPEGKPMNVVVNVRDLSKVRELENLRETFLSMLGHELQTPLSIIKGYADTLLQNEANCSKEMIRKSVQIIEEESDQLISIVDKLLLASRIAAGVPTLIKEQVNLPHIIDKVVRRLGVTSNLHKFEIRYDRDLHSIFADPMLIEKVLTNLIDNAIKYSPDGGKITISGENTDMGVRVTVADEGIGIPERDLGLVFTRFHRTDRSLARGVKGIGLGLYICKSIVEAHRGTIEAASKVGKGSQFTVFMPLK